MQKEQLSALMDGETLDSELLNELAHNPEMQKTWESYHLIRDSMRGDTPISANLRVVVLRLI